jgi:hypothetical protein
LLTHAGLHPSFVVSGVGAAGVAEWLNDVWVEDRVGRSVFSAVGVMRGGGDRFGGIFWGDAVDLQRAYCGVGGLLKQVCGHSSYAESLDGYPWLAEGLVCVDTGDSCAALVSDIGDGSDWRFVRSGVCVS